MQAQCPQCAQRIVIDDAKVPDKPFAVKCPKCQAVVRLPGRAAAPAAPPLPEPDFFDEGVPPPPPASAPAAPMPPSEAAAPALNEEMRSQMMAQLRRELSGPPGDASSSHERALVCVPDRGQAAAITLTLTRLGYSVDSVENPDEAGRLIEQGSYAVAATSRATAAPGRGESLYQRITRLSPEQRRSLFVVLVGDDFKTADGAQAFAVMADLVVHTREAASADTPIRTMLTERRRLYQAYLDARRRFEAASG